MKIAGIEHVQLAMPPGGDDRARDFYGGVLGLTEVPKPPALAVRGGLWFENDCVRIHLGIEKDFRAARKAHPALLVHGLDALARRLREAGYDVVEPEPLEGYDRMHTQDPFGNRIELMAPTGR
jgi:catechol 2,3-dioxygenase-like lactoylglutathione lyase family enzyme